MCKLSALIGYCCDIGECIDGEHCWISTCCGHMLANYIYDRHFLQCTKYAILVATWCHCILIRALAYKFTMGIVSVNLTAQCSCAFGNRSNYKMCWSSNWVQYNGNWLHLIMGACYIFASQIMVLIVFTLHHSVATGKPDIYRSSCNH